MREADRTSSRGQLGGVNSLQVQLGEAGVDGDSVEEEWHGLLEPRVLQAQRLQVAVVLSQEGRQSLQRVSPEDVGATPTLTHISLHCTCMYMYTAQNHLDFTLPKFLPRATCLSERLEATAVMNWGS